LVDEDMLQSTAKVLKTEGYEALDVRDLGLRGESDDKIIKSAQDEKAIILTGDVGWKPLALSGWQSLRNCDCPFPK
jgi:predicted nuclease of predicted toxin-antitoxin system